MPFKSLKQRAKFAQLVKEGKMSQETFDNWQSETGDKRLPVRTPYTPKGTIRGVRRVKSEAK